MRAMVFIDHLNFEIGVKEYYQKTFDRNPPKLDYKTFPGCVVSQFPGMELIKTFLFIPRPDEFLMENQTLKDTYQWAISLRTLKYFDVIEGEYVARPTAGLTKEQMRVDDYSTYYKVEKATDVNIAVEALGKAFNGAYDAAFFISADTDYLPIYRLLNAMGKLVIVVAVKGQYIGKLRPLIDNFLMLDDNFFSTCLREK